MDYNQAKQLILNIYEFVEKKDFNRAEKTLKKLQSMNDKKENEFNLNYLERYIKDEKNEYLNKDSNLINKEKEYLNLGIELLNNNKIDDAIEILKKGKEETQLPIFKYYLGICYFKKEEYAKTITFFTDYIMLESKFVLDACDIIVKAYEIKYKMNEEAFSNEEIDKSKYMHFNRKYNSAMLYYKEIKNNIENLKNGVLNVSKTKIKKENPKINTYDKEAYELIKSGKLNDISDIYQECDYDRKITILALLYMNGYNDFADKLLKLERHNFKEECPILLNQLNKNIPLYKNKYRFKK